MTMFRQLWNDDRGQHLVDYALALAFVVLASSMLMIGTSGSVNATGSMGQIPPAVTATSAS